jgi:putative methionine-R-sulfoxide reductase with GAF domain
LAKQFGVGEEAIAGLADPDRHPFPPEQAAALRLADAMTRGDGRVPDDLFEDLRRRFSEPQVVEIAAVIGLFNYFNRFNSALHVEITLTDPDVIVRRVEQAAGTARGDAASLCDRVAEILAQGRRYSAVGIYGREEGRLVLRAHRGPAPPRRTLPLGEGIPGAAGRTGLSQASGSELAIPLRRGPDVVGVLDVRSGHTGGFEDEDRPLLERVAAILAPAVAGGH